MTRFEEFLHESEKNELGPVELLALIRYENDELCPELSELNSYVVQEPFVSWNHLSQTPWEEISLLGEWENMLGCDVRCFVPADAELLSFVVKVE